MSMTHTTTVYRARKIITMNPARPEATHVAVRDGRILGAGSLDELQGWGPHTLDDRFAEQVLMPGLVEGHSHLMAGTLWRYAYCGYFDVRDPAGRLWPGAKTLDEVVAVLPGPRPRWPTRRRRWWAGGSTRSTSAASAAAGPTWTG